MGDYISEPDLEILAHIYVEDGDMNLSKRTISKTSCGYYIDHDFMSHVIYQDLEECLDKEFKQFIYKGNEYFYIYKNCSDEDRNIIKTIIENRRKQ